MKDNKALVWSIALISAALGLVLYLWFYTEDQGIATTAYQVGKANIKVDINDSQTVTAGKKLSLDIGLSGLAAAKGSGVGGIAIKFSSLPSYLSNPVVALNSGLKEDWVAKLTGIEDGKMGFVARDQFGGHDLTKSVGNLATLTFDVGASVKDSQVVMEIEVADTNIPSKSNVLKHTLTLKAQAAAVKYYTISGTISGDTKEGVTVVCGSLSTKSDSSGYYAFSNVSDGTTCTLIPTKDKFVFTPSSAAIKVYGADVVQNFVASQVTTSTTGATGAQGPAGKDGKDGKDGDDGDDGKKGKTKVVYYSTGSGSSSSAPQYAPKSGVAENIIIAVASLLGLTGAAIFVGAKLKWFG